MRNKIVIIVFAILPSPTVYGVHIHITDMNTLSIVIRSIID